MRDFRYKIEYKMGKKKVVADQLSRPVRLIQGEYVDNWLGKSKEDIKGMQRAEQRWREMIEFIGGRIPRSKYPRATLDQFSLEDDVLYFCKKQLDGTLLYLLVVHNDLRKEALRHIHEKESRRVFKKPAWLIYGVLGRAWET